MEGGGGGGGLLLTLTLYEVQMTNPSAYPIFCQSEGKEEEKKMENGRKIRGGVSIFTMQTFVKLWGWDYTCISRGLRVFGGQDVFLGDCDRCF